MIFRNIVLATICLLCSSSALAAHLDLAWNPNSEPDLAGYIAYYGTLSGQYTTSLDVGKVTSIRITGLLEDTEYFIALTAYDIYGNESSFSAEASGYALPGADPDYDISGRPASGGGCFIEAASRTF